MAKKNKRGEIKEHPVLAAIREHGDGRTPVAMEGYVGRAASDDHLRLYPSLEDLTVYYDIPRDDIIASTASDDDGPCTLHVDAAAEIQMISVNASAVQAGMIDGSILASNLGNVEVIGWITITRTITTISKLKVCTGAFCRGVAGGAGAYSAFRCQTDIVDCPTVDCPTPACDSANCPPTSPAICTQAGCTRVNCRKGDLSITCKPSDPLLCTPRCPEWCADHDEPATMGNK